MKTSKTSTSSLLTYDNPLSDAQLQADFDDLTTRATHGDKRALGAIAVALGPALLYEARVVMGDFAQDAGDVLQDFFLSLLEGESRFTPEHERALDWMFGIIRAMARKRSADRERDWGIEEEP